MIKTPLLDVNEKVINRQIGEPLLFNGFFWIATGRKYFRRLLCWHLGGDKDSVALPFVVELKDSV